MKRFWTQDELGEHWTLSFDEIGLLKGKNRTARVGFSLQLKFYQLFLSFPSRANDFPRPVIDYVADQIDGVDSDLSDYVWNGRTARRHRQERGADKVRHRLSIAAGWRYRHDDGQRRADVPYFLGIGAV